MASLSAPLPRRLVHTRDVRTRGFLRDDGLWDIEGELRDEKTYTYEDRERGPLPAGSPMHLMRARLTVDHEMIVHAAEVDMDAIPFSTCAGAAAPAQELIGKSLKRGFGRAIEEAMGRTSGCTHVRYLILAMPSPILELAGSCSADSLQIRRVLNVQLFVYDPRLMRESTRGPDSEPIEYRNSLTC